MKGNSLHSHHLLLSLRSQKLLAKKQIEAKITEHIVSVQDWMYMDWVHGQLSPPIVPGERLPACEGDLGKDKFATARGGEV